MFSQSRLSSLATHTSRFKYPKLSPKTKPTLSNRLIFQIHRLPCSSCSRIQATHSHNLSSCFRTPSNATYHFSLSTSKRSSKGRLQGFRPSSLHNRRRFSTMIECARVTSTDPAATAASLRHPYLRLDNMQLITISSPALSRMSNSL